MIERVSNSRMNRQLRNNSVHLSVCVQLNAVTSLFLKNASARHETAILEKRCFYGWL